VRRGWCCWERCFGDDPVANSRLRDNENKQKEQRAAKGVQNPRAPRRRLERRAGGGGGGGGAGGGDGGVSQERAAKEQVGGGEKHSRGAMAVATPRGRAREDPVVVQAAGPRWGSISGR